MQKNSTLTITISPEIPHHIVEDTLEGRVLGHLIKAWRTPTGYSFSTDKGVSPFIEPARMLELVDVDTPMAKALREPIIAAAEAKEVLTLDDIGAAMGKPEFDFEHVLQEICKLYPDEIPFFEASWAVSQTLNPEHGRVGGGAQFITPDGIKTLTTQTWMEEQRGQYKHDNFQLRMDWNEISTGWLYQNIPHTDWRSIVSENPEEFVQIEDVAGGHEVSIMRSAGVGEYVDTYRSLRDAMLAGQKIIDEADLNQEARVLASMGLPADEWNLEFNSLGEPVAYNQISSSVFIQYDAGRWVLLDDGMELARSSDPSELPGKVGPAVHR